MKVIVDNVTDPDEEATKSADGEVVMDESGLIVPSTPVISSGVIDGRVMDAPSHAWVAVSSVSESVSGHVFSSVPSFTLALCSRASVIVVQGRSCHPQYEWSEPVALT